MGHYATPLVTSYFPTQPLPREAEDFPRGGNHSKHMPLLTYLTRLQPIYYNLFVLFVRARPFRKKIKKPVLITSLILLLESFPEFASLAV